MNSFLARLDAFGSSLTKPYGRMLAPVTVEDFFNFDYHLFSRFENLLKTNGVVIRRDNTDMILDIDLPGFTKDDVDVEIEDGILSVKAEKTGNNTKISFAASYTFPESADAEMVTASVKNGVLSVIIPNIIPETTDEVDVGDESNTVDVKVS